MERTLTVAELEHHFADYIDRVVDGGERFRLTREGRTVAELRPITPGRRLAELPVLVAALPRLSEEEASSFAEDLSHARSELWKQPPPDPWDS